MQGRDEKSWTRYFIVKEHVQNAVECVSSRKTNTSYVVASRFETPCYRCSLLCHRPIRHALLHDYTFVRRSQRISPRLVFTLFNGPDHECRLHSFTAKSIPISLSNVEISAREWNTQRACGCQFRHWLQIFWPFPYESREQFGRSKKIYKAIIRPRRGYNNNKTVIRYLYVGVGGMLSTGRYHSTSSLLSQYIIPGPAYLFIAQTPTNRS